MSSRKLNPKPYQQLKEAKPQTLTNGKKLNVKHTSAMKKLSKSNEKYNGVIWPNPWIWPKRNKTAAKKLNPKPYLFHFHNYLVDIVNNWWLPHQLTSTLFMFDWFGNPLNNNNYMQRMGLTKIQNITYFRYDMGRSAI